MTFLNNLYNFTDILNDDTEVIENSQPMSLNSATPEDKQIVTINRDRPDKYTGQYGVFRSIEEIDFIYRHVFKYPFFNLVQSRVIEDALYTDNSLVVCAPTGSGKTVVFEMAIVRLLMELEDQGYTEDFKIIYMAPVKAICTERLTEWYAKFTELGVLCIEVTGDTDVDFSQLKPYRIIITTPEKWDILTRRWTDHRSLVEVIKLFLIDEVHILNDESRGPVLEAVVSRMRTIEASCITSHRNELLKRKVENNESLAGADELPPRIRFVAVSATVSNPEDVATWLGNADKPAVCHKFGDECRPVKINRIVEGYPCPAGTSIFKFDIILNYKLWAIIQRYYFGKPTLIFCNTRKGVVLTAETLSREITITFNPEQLSKLTALASTMKNKKLQTLVLSGVGCHHAGMLFEERVNIEQAFRSRNLPILITTTTLAMGVNLPAHLVIIKNTQYYVNGAYQEYPISTVLQMIGRAGRPQFDSEATAVIMTRTQDKSRYQSLVEGSEPLQSYLHRRLAENLNSEAALHTVTDLAQCVDWLRSTFLFVRAGRDPRRYLNLPANATSQHISKKIEDLCVKAMNGLASSGLITVNDACCIESTEAGRLMSIFYIDFETMKYIMKIDGTESLERLLWVLCESHELSEMHLRVDERRCLNTLNRSNASATIRFPMKGKICTRQMKLNCIIQAVLGGLPIPEPALNQEATRIMRIADRVCKCLISYITRPEITSHQSSFYYSILNGITLGKCIAAQLWENSPYVCRQLKGIGPAFSTSLVTAGKINFLLLEESHPRDLERIMNKGPPAGNILRKQISLLPKYQLILTPLNHKTVTIKVSLLNQAYLSENIDNLTAGSNHKAYVIIGDADNTLLLFSSFRDMDLINVYDGCITYLVDRKYEYKHTIIVNCISATFVGIDVTAEYTFQKADHIQNESSINETIIQSISPKRVTNKQTTITEILKEKKRKTNDIQFTEKKKRNYAIINEINLLKQNLGSNYKALEDQQQKSKLMSQNILNEINNKIENNTEKSHVYNEIPQKNITNLHDYVSPVISVSLPVSDNISNSIKENNITLDNKMEIGDTFSEIDLPDYDRINKILNKVENEINDHTPQLLQSVNIHIGQNNLKNNTNLIPLKLSRSTGIRSKQINKQKQDNYAFLELLDKNNENLHIKELTDETVDDSGFSKAIKLNLDTFLENTKEQHNKKDLNIVKLLSNNIITNQYDQNNNDQIISVQHKHKSVEKNYNSSCNENCISQFNVESIQLESNTNYREFMKENENELIQIKNNLPGQLARKSNTYNKPYTQEINPTIAQYYRPDTLNQNIITIPQNKLNTTTFNKHNDELNSNINIEIVKCATGKCNENNTQDMLSELTKIQYQNKSEKNDNDSSHSTNNVGLFKYINGENKNINSSIVVHQRIINNSSNTNRLYNNLIPKHNKLNINNLTNDNVIYALNSNDESTCKPTLIIDDILYNMKFTEKIKPILTTPIFTETIVSNNNNTEGLIVNRKDNSKFYNIIDYNSLNNSTIQSTNYQHFCNNELSDLSNIDQGLEKISNNYYKNSTYNDNGNTKFIKINNVETSLTSNFSTYDVKYFPNKKHTKYQLELIKKIKLDLDITEVINKEIKEGCMIFERNKKYDDNAQIEEKYLKLDTNVSNMTKILTNTQQSAINSNDLNLQNPHINSIQKINFVTKDSDNGNDLVQYCTNIYNKVPVNMENSTLINRTQEEYSNVNIKDSPLSILKSNNDINKTEITPKLHTPKLHSLELSDLTQLQDEYDVKKNDQMQIDINFIESDQNVGTFLGTELKSDYKPKKIDKTSLNIGEDNTENLTVNNILSKYFNALRDNDIIPTPEETERIKNVDTNYDKSNTKPKKLFQIRDINHIDIKLPNNLIPNIPSNTSIEEVENYIENKQNDYDQLKIDEIMETSSLQVNSHLCETKIDVDQSLLDPKKMLEFYEDNIETVDIVPPPLEFADDINHADQELGNNWDFMEVENSYTNKLLNNSSNFNEPISENIVDEKKLFEDVCGPSVASVNMSISHEVETWTLTPKNYANDTLNDSSIKSFTVMRTNPIYSTSTNFNRKEKFNNFKFKNKERFRFRK